VAWWQRCSRRGRAEASLLTGFVHRRHTGIPPPSLAVANAGRGRAPRRPARRLTPAPVRPQGAPCLPPGHAGRPLHGDRLTPPAKGTFPLPGPGRLRCAQTAKAGRYCRRCRDLRTRQSPASYAGAPGRGRHGLRRDYRVPSVVVIYLPASRRPRFPRTPGSGDFLSGRFFLFLLVGRRDPPSASLRTEHVSLACPRPGDRFRGLQGAGQSLPAVGLSGWALINIPASFLLNYKDA